MTVAQVMSQIEKDVVFYDQSGGGVTFSGGEPLMQCGFLRALLRECKERGIHTAVDTSGLANGKALEQIGECADLFLYDLKIMNAEKHRHFTGVSNALILDNLRALAQSGRQIRIRAPIIPGINDDEGNISELGQFVASLARRPPVSLLPYHKAGVHKYARLQKAYALPEAPTPQEERMNTIAKALTSHGLEVRVGG
jgi:pyruvate formate lyase activating enzyme